MTRHIFSAAIFWVVVLPAFFVAFSAASPCAFAKDTAGQENSGKPIEIEASGTLEWLRAEQKYVARGDVLASQGDFSISCNRLVADYKKSGNSNNNDGKQKEQTGTKIWRITAYKNVVIKNGENTAYGDLAVYDVDKGKAVLTGKNLKLVTPEQVITARNSMEYLVDEEKASATGDVRITKGGNTLKGYRAVVDMKSDISKIFGNPKSNTRVRAVFYPKKTEK